MQKKREKKISTCYSNNNMQIFYEYVLLVFLRFFNFLKYIYTKKLILLKFSLYLFIICDY